ncbi:KH domain-containing protein [Aggregatilineales bacterium SYSU G02658]
MSEDLIRFIAEHLVNDPSAVQIVTREAGKSVVIELRVDKADMGRIIGKNGRVANAMRDLLRVATENNRNSKRVILEIE